jgi:hypothetical protein
MRKTACLFQGQLHWQRDATYTGFFTQLEYDQTELPLPKQHFISRCRIRHATKRMTTQSQQPIKHIQGVALISKLDPPEYKTYLHLQRIL